MREQPSTLIVQEQAFVLNPQSAEILLYKPWRPKGSLQFEIITNVLVRSFRFI